MTQNSEFDLLIAYCLAINISIN